MSNIHRHHNPAVRARKHVAIDTECVPIDCLPDRLARLDSDTTIEIGLSLEDTAVSPALPAPPPTVKYEPRPADTPKPVPAAAPQPAPPPRAGRVRRLARRTAALVLLLLVGWFWAVPFFFPVTSRAVVNARLVQVRAPISGQITTLPVAVGDTVTAGAPVLRVAGRNVDVAQLSTLRGRHAELTARRARLAVDLADTTAAEAACRADLDRYQRAVVENLRATQREGEARVKMAEVEHDGADRRLGQMRDLVSRQAVSAKEHNDHRDNATWAEARIALERAALSRTRQEVEAAERGLFVARDAPAIQLQARDLGNKLPRLRAEMAEADALLAAAGTVLRAEEERVGRLLDSPVPAPVSGVVWKRAGSPAQVVERNEVVFDVADQDTIFVEALIHQRHLRSVAPGARAVVNLTGGATLTGCVRAVRTPNPDETEPGFALSLTDRDLKQLKVIVALDPPAADAALIGRHGQVLITGADAGPVDHGVAWLFTRLRF